jgi:hypothetical protein
MNNIHVIPQKFVDYLKTQHYLFPGDNINGRAIAFASLNGIAKVTEVCVIEHYKPPTPCVIYAASGSLVTIEDVGETRDAVPLGEDIKVRSFLPKDVFFTPYGSTTCDVNTLSDTSGVITNTRPHLATEADLSYYYPLSPTPLRTLITVNTPASQDKNYFQLCERFDATGPFRLVDTCVYVFGPLSSCSAYDCGNSDYNFAMGSNFFDSLYFTVITYFTIGLGDALPISGRNRLRVFFQAFLASVVSLV